jgi:ribosomal protein S18 acetylase RimI-like enzyme
MLTDHKPQLKQSLQNVIIRPLIRSDLPLLEWEGVYTHFRCLFLDAYNRMCQDHAMIWIATTDNDVMLGQLFTQLSSNQLDLADGYFRAYMFGFRVKPQYRRMGIGTLLLLQAEKDLVNRNFHRVCLNVVKDNWRARQLYGRHGYKVIKTDPGKWSYQDNEGVWHDIEEPAWRMEKSLSDM